MPQQQDITAGIGFRQPFQDQLDFFRSKLNLPTERWDDIMRAAHDRAFIVAGAAKADLLEDLRRAVDDAIAKGISIGEFRRQFAEIVARHGWTGWTGQGTAGGQAWRTRVIYQTNLQTSYAAGRWRQLNEPAVLAGLPYWEYVHRDGVLHPRPQHLAWHGLTLRHDDAFWRRHYPPNGWGCHCRVRARARPRAGLPTERPADWDEIDPKTQAPRGIDKGFDYAPGRTWHPDLDKYSPALARQVVAANLKDGVFDRWLAQIEKRIAGQRTTTASSMELRKSLARGERVPVAVLDEQGLRSMGIQRDERGLPVTHTVWLSDDTAIKQSMHREGQALPIGGYVRLQSILDQAEFVESDGSTRMVYFHQGPDLSVAVIKSAAQGTELYLLSMRRASQRELDASIRSGKAKKWKGQGAPENP